MKKRFFLLLLITQCETYSFENEKKFDVTVIGFINFADGIGRQAIGFIDCLKNDVSINFINTRKNACLNTTAISQEVKNIIFNSEPGSSHVSILEDVLTNGSKTKPQYYYQYVPQSTVKLAYSMFESTAIPQEWVPILNTHFDAVVVPDAFLIDVYKNSGVTIPIFVLPLGIYIEHFLQQPLKEKANTPFVFGFTGAFSERKNHALLIESFAKEFGNRDDVLLKIHGRFGNKIYTQLAELIKSLGVSNIELILKSFSQEEYTDFMNSLDCYVSLSKGEGFSITPREVLAAGIPSIVSNNTAQKTICDSGHVYAVTSQIEEPAFYDHLQEFVGCNFNCTQEDVREALRNVYNNYDAYLKKAHKGREWASQYMYENLRPFYITLVKPKKVILGSRDALEDNVLITTSTSLYEKYKSIIEK